MEPSSPTSQPSSPGARSNVRRQSLAVYSRQLSLPSMMDTDVETTTVNTSSTVDTKSVRKALKIMRDVKLEKESREARKQRMKEASLRRKEIRKILADKQKLYACDPVLKLNSVESLRNQAIDIYTEKCAKERKEKYSEMIAAPQTTMSHCWNGVSAEFIQQIVDEEQELMDSGIDIRKAMSITHKEDREKYKSARERLAEKKAQEIKDAKDFFKKQKEASAREIHMV